MTKTLLSLFASGLLFVPSGMLVFGVMQKQSNDVYAWPSMFGLYFCVLVALWDWSVSWKRRLAAACVGGAIAIISGLIASRLFGEFVYGAVTFTFAGIPASIAGTQVVLGRFAERRHTEQKTDGGVILAFGILLAYLFFSAPPYLTFPWLLGVGVVGTSGYFGLMALRLTRGWLTAASVVALVFVFLAVRMISRAAQEQYLNLLK